jgi:hypothetical protein
VFVFQPYLATLREVDSLNRNLVAQAEEIAATQKEIAAATDGIQRASDYIPLRLGGIRYKSVT